MVIKVSKFKKSDLRPQIPRKGTYKDFYLLYLDFCNYFNSNKLKYSIRVN